LIEISPDIGQILSGLRAAWAIAMKDIRIYYLKPNIIVAGMLFPLFMFLAFAVGRNAPLGSMIPSLIAITILFSASTIEPVSIPIERRTKTFERLISAPVSLNFVVLGESLSGFLYSIGIASVPFLIGILLFGTTITNPLSLLAGVLLTAFCFATMGTLFAAYPAESPGEIISMVNLIRLPLIFISGTFIPLDQMPDIGKIASLLSPLTYGNDLIAAAYNRVPYFNPFLDCAVLVGFILLFQVIANGLYRKFIE
jgi:ABC-2 type transport system permease protein